MALREPEAGVCSNSAASSGLVASDSPVNERSTLVLT
jgi:hypothetical protein